MNLPDFISLDSTHIVELIRLDPVTYALYYKHRMDTFHKLLQKGSSIRGEVVDFFFVTKFQHSGSEHEHSFIWIKNAPKFKTDSAKKH